MHECDGEPKGNEGGLPGNRQQQNNKDCISGDCSPLLPLFPITCPCPLSRPGVPTGFSVSSLTLRGGGARGRMGMGMGMGAWWGLHGVITGPVRLGLRERAVGIT